jgi:putative hydrolase of the HAD superfamily
MSNIQAVIFDIGKVLINYDFDIFVDKVNPYSVLRRKEILDKISYGKVLKTDHLGKFDKDDFLEFLKQDLILKGVKKDQLGFFWESLLIDENSAIKNIIKKINPDLNKLILSDIGVFHWEKAKDYPIIKEFFPNQIQQVLSYKVGYVKPEREIFEEALSRYNLKPDQALFIDDREINTEGFKKLGGNAIQYNLENDSLEDLAKELENFGVLEE